MRPARNLVAEWKNKRRGRKMMREIRFKGGRKWVRRLLVDASST